MSSDYGYEFWNNVDKARAGLSLSDIAKALEINYQSIRDQRTNNRLPKLDDAYKIASHLNVSLEYLLTGTETASSPEELYVRNNIEMRTLVRYCMRDNRLLALLKLFAEQQRVDIEKEVKEN